MSHNLRMTRVKDDDRDWDGDEQLKGLTKEQMEQRIAHLTTQGDGSEGQDNDDDEEEEDNDQEPEYQIYQNIQEIIPGLFIGDYTAAIDGELLRSKGIQFVVAASECGPLRWLSQMRAETCVMWTCSAAALSGARGEAGQSPSYDARDTLTDLLCDRNQGHQAAQDPH